MAEKDDKKVEDLSFDDDLRLDEEPDLEVNVDDDDVTGALTKARLSSTLFRLIQMWKEKDVLDLVEDGKAVGYSLDKNELLMISDFIVPNNVPEIIKALEGAVAGWARLGFHAENVADIEVAAYNDLVHKQAESTPDAEEKKDKKYTEIDRQNIVELATVKEKEVYRNAKKLRKKLNLMVSCTKEYINVLKKLLDYHMVLPSTRGNS